MTTIYIAGIYERQGAAVTSYYEGGGIRRSGYTSNNGVFYMLSDHLKSTSALVARNGVLNVKYIYYPYGARRGVPFNSITAKHFTGQYHETALPGGEGLSFYNARWYDPKLGSFLSADSIVPAPLDPQSLNRYAYAGGNPLRFSDPSGHMKLCGAACEDEYKWSAPEKKGGGTSGGSGSIPVGGGTNNGIIGPKSPQKTANPVVIRQPIALRSWEVELLRLVAIFEAGAQSYEQVEYVTWTILNRFNNKYIATAPGYARLESILMSDVTQYHVVFGAHTTPPSGGIFLVELIGSRPLGAEIVGNTYQDWLSHPAKGSLIRQRGFIVDQVLDAYNNGVSDPTGGADSFFHVPPGMGEVRSTRIHELTVGQGNLMSANAVGWLPGNGLAPPHGQSLDMVYWRQFPWPP